VLTQVPTAYAAGNHEVNSPGLYEDAFQGFSDDSGAHWRQGAHGGRAAPACLARQLARLG
jgi:hypothetical protein